MTKNYTSVPNEVVEEFIDVGVGPSHNQPEIEE